MEEIIRQLYERFSLLSRLTVTQTDNRSTTDALVPFFGFLLAVMDAPPKQPLCFVLPRCGDTGRFAVVLHALHRFINKQQQLTHDCGAANFNKGDRVRVHPGRRVFVYDGFDDNSTDWIWLKTLDGNGRRNFRSEFIIPRLEKTDLKRPIGRLDSPLLSPPPAPLDTLLETSTFGNLSLVQNEAVLLDSRSGFTDFVDSVVLQRQSLTPDAPPFKALLPFGELSEPHSSKQSWLKKWDERNPAGEPLVAVTHSAELLANYCIDATAKSKLVVINGLSRLKQRQSYDDMAESQNLILFASRDEEEMIETLGNAPVPCKFWWLSADEINIGHGLPGKNGLSGLTGKVIQWANNHKQMSMEAIPCENQELESICLRLEELRGQLNSDENDPLTKLISHAWRLLNDASGVIRPLTDLEKEKFASQIRLLRSETKGNVWLKPECAAALNDIADCIESCLLGNGALGVNKASALYQVIRESQSAGLKYALLARNENQIVEVKSWLRQRNISLEIYSPRTLPDDKFFDRLIFLSWPGSHHLRRIVDLLVSPRITVLAYPFEARWLNQCKRRFQHRPKVPAVTISEKSEFVFHEKTNKSAWLEDAQETVLPSSTALSDTEIWNFEQRLRTVRKGKAASPTEASETITARYVSFVGDFYSFLMESHKLPIATSLVSGSLHTSQKLPERTVLDIKVGDFIVFPESGDREFIQDAADKLVGSSAPQIRMRARKWKDALQKSGLTSDQFYQQARSLNHPRHSATIRHWFADSSQIGPREKDDLVLIALVTGDEEFESEIDGVRQAIERLWGAHQSAGMRLRDVLLQRLPQVIGQVEENGTQVDLGELGSAWIVQVDSIASDNEQRGRNEVNQLLRENSVFQFL